MDQTLFKTTTTSRGLKYRYYFSPAQTSKPTLLLLHGFPSHSNDWRHQVSFFGAKGYGLIVPDLLGYGGSAKPTEVTNYKSSLICKDIIDILDDENIDQAIAIGHDWYVLQHSVCPSLDPNLLRRINRGSKVTSRLANIYPERFAAFAFLAVSYVTPNPQFDIQTALDMTKKMVGYEIFGYWLFFSEDEADKLIETHVS